MQEVAVSEEDETELAVRLWNQRQLGVKQCEMGYPGPSDLCKIMSPEMLKLG